MHVRARLMLSLNLAALVVAVLALFVALGPRGLAAQDQDSGRNANRCCCVTTTTRPHPTTSTTTTTTFPPTT